MTQEEILKTKESITDMNNEALFMDGFDEAIMGMVARFNAPPIVLYNYDKVIEILIAGGLEAEAAVEYFDFNIIGSWVGEGTPAFFYSMD